MGAGGAATAVATPQIDQAAIEGADKYLKAVLSKDAAAVAACYLEDGVLMPTERPLVRGRAAIEQYYRGQFKGPTITDFTFTHLESPVVGNTAYDVGTYKLTMSLGPGGTVNDAGKYSVILKRSGGEWKIAYLIYNSDSPSKMPPQASGTDNPQQ